MRRRDREVTDPAAIAEIIESCKVMRIGLVDGKSAYIVPVNFGYKVEDGKYTFYFHGAIAGRKYELIRKNGYCGFEMDEDCGLLRAEEACGHTEFYRSIIGEGACRIVEDPAEVAEGLNLVMLHNTGKGDWTFPEAALKMTAVIRIDPEMMTAKQNA
ncbi:MAG: pyridoxamine 5'-phosphate oxidase family protein [Mogibacterium sp.]|nr:pyridoxamine 5'-phosphate oxidase family protein [Mogibacterium sp.]